MRTPDGVRGGRLHALIAVCAIAAIVLGGFNNHKVRMWTRTSRGGGGWGEGEGTGGGALPLTVASFCWGTAAFGRHPGASRRGGEAKPPFKTPWRACRPLRT